MKRRDFAKALVFPLAAIALTAPWTRARADRPDAAQAMQRSLPATHPMSPVVPFRSAPTAG